MNPLCWMLGHKPDWIPAPVPNPWAISSKVWGCTRCREILRSPEDRAAARAALRGHDPAGQRQPEERDWVEPVQKRGGYQPSGPTKPEKPKNPRNPGIRSIWP